MKKLRLAFEKTQEEIGAAGGFPPNKISLVESGKDKMTSPDVLGALGKAFGVTPGIVWDYARGFLTVDDVKRAAETGSRTIERETRYPRVAEWIDQLRERGEPERLIRLFEAEVSDYKGEPTDADLQSALRRARKAFDGATERRTEIARLIAEIDPAFSKRPDTGHKPRRK